MDIFLPKGKKTHTKSRDTITQTSIAPRDLPQYPISFEVSFQERVFGLLRKELVYRIERSISSKIINALATLDRNIYAAKRKRDAHNRFINRLLQLVPNIPTCILYFLPNISKYLRSAESAEGTLSCSSIITHGHAFLKRERKEIEKKNKEKEDTHIKQSIPNIQQRQRSCSNTRYRSQIEQINTHDESLMCYVEGSADD
jgi:hypothetical protein